MAIYAIGDIQGCYDDLLRLLDAIAFNEHDDQLWFTGDLVNRGPQSLATLRFVKSLGGSAVTVLGNHDLHLLAAYSRGFSTNPKDTFNDVLTAPDCDELMHWLRHQFFFHYNNEFCLVHAGLPPQWDFETTVKMAALAEVTLRSAKFHDLLTTMYCDSPDMWSPQLYGANQLRFIINCFTRMRYCDENGRLDFEHNGPVGTQPKHLIPWFSLPSRKTADQRIIFGHWSALGYYEGHNCIAIDTGCLWGGQLTAIKLGEIIERISIDCQGYRIPSNPNLNAFQPDIPPAN